MKEELQVLFEDNHIIVVVKPQNIPSQADISGDEDMLTIIRNYLKKKYGKPGNVFVGLVHRLDRPTGGVMVFAKTSKAASRLSEAIREGEFEKTYLAVVDGKPKEDEGTYVHYLKKNTMTNMVYVVPSATDGAKRAELNYQVLEAKGKFNLVRVQLITGRGHQIRVQMSTEGTPICGDSRYGSEYN
ncbi:MAG: RNA pseudouridine synthase, partial [Clostridia bacterium]